MAAFFAFILRHSRNARAVSPMIAIGMLTPMATLAPGVSPDGGGRAVGDWFANPTWPLLVETAVIEIVLLGMTRSVMVGRGALTLTVHPPEVESGHFGGVSVGVYVARDMPVGVRVSHWLEAVSHFPR